MKPTIYVQTIPHNDADATRVITGWDADGYDLIQMARGSVGVQGQAELTLVFKLRPTAAQES